MKRALALALSLVMAVMLFAACGSSPAASTPAPAPSAAPSTAESEAPAELSGKITISAWDLTTQLQYVQTVVDAFTLANPGVEVEIIDIASDDYNNKLSIDLNGGAAADVILIKEASTMPSLVAKGQLADLSGYIAADGVDLSRYNGLAESLQVGGIQAGLPVRSDYYILYYNKDIFDAAGKEYPSNDMTWAEFEALAKELTSGSGQDKTYGAFFHSWQALVQNWGVQDGKNTILGPDYSFMKPAYEMVLRMQDEGSIMDYATITTSSLHYSSVFQNGNVAMLPMGSWFMATMIKAVNEGETDVNWGIATIPHFDGVESGYTVGSTTPIAVNEASANKDAAWALVKFFSGEEGAKILADAGQFPGSNNAELLTTIASTEGMPEGAQEALAVKNISLDRPIAEFVTEVNQMLGEEHSLIMLGENTLDEGLAAFAERSAEIQGE